MEVLPGSVGGAYSAPPDLIDVLRDDKAEGEGKEVRKWIGRGKTGGGVRK